MGLLTPSAIPYPEPTDPVANGAADMRALAEGINPLIVHKFATTAERDAEWPAATAGNGALCYITANGSYWMVIANTWRPTALGGVPTFRIQGGVAQSVAPNGWIAATFGTKMYDDYGVVTTAGVFTVPAGYAGRWAFEWAVRFPSPSTGVRAAALATGPTRHGTTSFQAAANGDSLIAGATTVLMTAGAIAAVQVFHSHSASLPMNASTDENFTGHFLGLS